MRDFRDLYKDIVRYSGNDLYRDVLLPFVPYGLEEMKPLGNLSKLSDSLPGSFDDEYLWSLFALNVCNDMLRRGMTVSRGEYLDFFYQLGFETIEHGRKFNPLIHEIVDVGNFHEPKEGISLGYCYWPGLRFGELIFSRCAVDVFCDESWGIVEGIADSSTLYFANYRTWRKASDLSHGWGSNSRWATSFRRDYEVGNTIFLNIDAEYDLATEPGPAQMAGDLTLEQARELLFNRCLTSTKPDDDEHWPYDWNLSLKKQDAMWPMKSEMIIPTAEALKAVAG